MDLRQDPQVGGGSMNFKYGPESKPLEGYTIKRAIQRGGFGEVYYALSDAGKEVALKLLQGNADVELRGIAQCLNLKHANLLSIFDVKQSDAGEMFVVMEYVAGRTLAEVISEKPDGLEHEYIELILEQLAAGADYLHERGIVHRDLKPANIYLENGTIKIGDVGLAKFISESRRSAQTQSVGTVYYMAPEIAHGRYGREVDVYAIGVMLYEMLTGNVPFDGESAGEILMKQLSAEPNLTVLPESLRPVLANALAKDPEQRTASVREVAEEFSAALHGTVSAVQQPPKAGYQSEPDARTESSRSSSPHRSRSYESARRAWRGPEPWYRDPVNWWIIGGVGVALVFLSPVIPLIATTVLVLSLPILLLAAFLAASYGLVRFILRAFFTEEPGGQYVRLSSRHGDDGQHGIRLNSRYVRYMSAHSDRQMGLLERVAESTGSMAIAAMCSALIALALLTINTIVKTPADATLFAVITTLGAWAAILPAKMWEGRGGDGTFRRLTTALLGGLVGAGGFAVDESLMVDLPVRGYDQIVERIAGNEAMPVALSHGDASRLAGYVAFFGILMLIRRWWYHVDSYRPHRFRVMSVFWTAVAAWLLSLVTYFPAEWAVLWGIAISTSAQLAAVWVHPEHRSAPQS